MHSIPLLHFKRGAMRPDTATNSNVQISCFPTRAVSLACGKRTRKRIHYFAAVPQNRNGIACIFDARAKTAWDLRETAALRELSLKRGSPARHSYVFFN